MDLLVALLAVSILLCIRKPAFGEDPMGTVSLLPVRGICAVGVILHHVAQMGIAQGTRLLGLFSHVGYMIVAVFFAISGYALAAQYQAKGDAYLKTFLSKRLTSLLKPWLIMTALFLAWSGLQSALAGEGFLRGVFWKIRMRLVTNELIVPFSWYVEMIVLLYVLFYVVYRLWGKHAILRNGAMALGVAGIMAAGLSLELPGTWFQSLPAFAFGFLYWQFAHSPLQSKIPLPVQLILSAGLFAGTMVFKFFDRGAFNFLGTIVVSLAFPAALFSLLAFLRLRSPVLDYLGSRSYMLYLVQGVPMTLLGLPAFQVGSGWLYLLLCLLGSVVAAELLYRVCTPKRRG